MEVLEHSPEEIEDLVVSRLPAPSEDLVDRIHLLSSEATRFARGLVQNEPHRVRHLRRGPSAKYDGACAVRVSGHAGSA